MPIELGMEKVSSYSVPSGFRADLHARPEGPSYANSSHYTKVDQLHELTASEVRYFLYKSSVTKRLIVVFTEH